MDTSFVGNLLLRARRLVGKDADYDGWRSFRARANTLIRRMKDWPHAGFAAAKGERVGVVVTPWVRSDVPLFSIECALRLASAGSKVLIYYDHADILGNAPFAEEIEIIGRVLARLPAELQVVDMSASRGSHGVVEDAEAWVIVQENAIRTTLGEAGIADFLAAKPEALETTKRHLEKIHHPLASQPVDWILIPGGIYGVSSGYIAMARKLGIGFTSYDSDAGMLMLAHNSVACHQEDIADGFRRVMAGTSAEDREWMVGEAQAEMNRRIAGNDDWSMQKVAASGEAFGEFNILVPLNLRWDSAALGRQRLFPSVGEWIKALVHWAEGEPRARLCIRQHPSERFERLRSIDDIGALLARINRLGDRVRFVAAADPVSTYDIMKTADVILPFTSTLALEGAMQGRQPILSTWCYYAGFEFAWNASTVEEYFDLIRQGISGALIPPPTAQATAAIVYFLTQRCNQMRTLFTPVPVDFPKWSALSPRDLWRLPEMEDIFQCLSTREPLSSIRCRRMLRERGL